MPSAIIDITPKLHNGVATYPGNPPFEMHIVRSVAEGAHSTLSEVRMGTHSGLHVDAPAHFIAGAGGLEEQGLEALVGPCRVVEFGEADRVAIDVTDLEPLAIEEGERVLFKTRNSEMWAREGFDPTFVHLSTEAARYLAFLHPACVGVDYLSVGGFRGNGTEVHEALLGAGVLAIEGCDLRGVAPGDYELICLPLRLDGAEAAPARAILRPLPSSGRNSHV